MKINEIIKILQIIFDEFGNLDCCVNWHEGSTEEIIKSIFIKKYEVSSKCDYKDNYEGSLIKDEKIIFDFEDNTPLWNLKEGIQITKFDNAMKNISKYKKEYSNKNFHNLKFSGKPGKFPVK